MFSTQWVLRKIRDGGDHELFFFRYVELEQLCHIQVEIPL